MKIPKDTGILYPTTPSDPKRYDLNRPLHAIGCFLSISMTDYNHLILNDKKYENLSMVSLEEINNAKNDLSINQFKRAVFVYNENRRAIKSAELIEKNDLSEFGKLMYQSHEGLKNNYEVSCNELDFLVNQTKKIDGVIGARMMGGGFGGCTVNLIKSNEISDVVSKIKVSYKSNFGINLKAIIAKPGSGIKVVKN